jgi:glycosyltransferase involved in cell wall biosynthesis
MRIGVDATCWQNRRGYGRHARALLGALVQRYPEHEYVFFLDSKTGLETIPSAVQLRVIESPNPTAVAAGASGRRSLRDMWRVSRAISQEPLDVLLFPTIYSFVPTTTQARKLIVIHDVIAEKFPNLTIPDNTARLFWRLKVAMGRMQADTLITVSEFSRQAISQHFGIKADRIQVVGEASDPIFRVQAESKKSQVMQKLGILEDARLVVYVGGFSPHKDVPALVEAFHKVRDQFPTAILVLAGELESEVFHSHIHAVRDCVKEFALESRVIFTGRISDEDLVPLLNHSDVLVLPSLMEGFGLPAIEAAACGCPVIATKQSPLPQLLGEGGIYIEPRTGELEQALIRVLSSASLRARMKEAAVEAASRLTWEAAAAQLMSVIAKSVGLYAAA